MQHRTFWPSGPLAGELGRADGSVTEQWAQNAVAGPRARDTLRGRGRYAARPIQRSLSLSDSACAGHSRRRHSARLVRISFAGRAWIELAVPAAYGDATVRALWARAPSSDRALRHRSARALRIEKGHVAGSELNGQTNAHDLGMGRMVSTPRICVGASWPQRSRSWARTDCVRRLQACRCLAAAARRARIVGVGKEARTEHDEAI